MWRPTTAYGVNNSTLFTDFSIHFHSLQHCIAFIESLYSHYETYYIKELFHSSCMLSIYILFLHTWDHYSLPQHCALKTHSISGIHFPVTVQCPICKAGPILINNVRARLFKIRDISRLEQFLNCLLLHLHAHPLGPKFQTSTSGSLYIRPTFRVNLKQARLCS